VRQLDESSNWARDIKNDVANDSRKQPWKAVFEEKDIKQIARDGEDLATYNCGTAGATLWGGN
jgi:hypothetical protein